MVRSAYLQENVRFISSLRALYKLIWNLLKSPKEILNGELLFKFVVRVRN